MQLEPAVPPKALAAIREPFQALGAKNVDAPVIQPLNQLLDLAGEALRARLFIVQGDGGAESCLRPDFTIPVARAHRASGAASGRYVYEGKAFRVAPKGSERAEEFLQIGMEAFEARDPVAADIEVAAVAWQASCAGGRTDLSMRLGDVALFSAFIGALALPEALAARLDRAFSRPRVLKAELARAQSEEQAPRAGDRLAGLLAGLAEAEATAVLEELWGLAGIQPVGGRSPAEIIHRLSERAEAASAPRLTAAQSDLIGRFLAIDDQPRRALDAVAALAREGGASLDGVLGAWEGRLDGLTAAGIAPERLSLSTAFGRAFGYYDGVLFEVASAALGAERPVAGGGRYDSLLARLGAGHDPAIGAVGCMVRPWRAFAGSANASAGAA
jgi:ATP phosphoribosyltransferase regulatory subunit